MKQAILTVSYGTAEANALRASIAATESAIAQAFPAWEVRRAFTGRRIREILQKSGVTVDSVDEALARLAADGFSTVILQPTHILPGDEYESIRAAAENYADRFAKITVGAPLLRTQQDLCELTDFLAAEYANSATVLMGHGSAHAENRLYAELAALCAARTDAQLYVATLEATPSLDDLLPILLEKNVRAVQLAPLLFVAGGHACRDMAGDSPESWKSRLEAAGIAVTPIVRGLGEYEAVRQMYVRRLRAVIEE